MEIEKIIEMLFSYGALPLIVLFLGDKIINGKEKKRKKELEKLNQDQAVLESKLEEKKSKETLAEKQLRDEISREEEIRNRLAKEEKVNDTDKKIFVNEMTKKIAQDAKKIKEKMSKEMSISELEEAVKKNAESIKEKTLS